ncbi:MAG: signal recognition particle protein [Planctomycetota bacterium]|jgi:signal recognition particle subunit SRP54|nr:signal recognition particle protein [Planctomycetota bacterium]
MFESLTDKMTGVFRTLAGTAKISESNVEEAARQVRLALLEADVSLSVVKGFVERVKNEALGEKVLNAVKPGEQFVKIVHDELVALLGGERDGVRWQETAPTVVMLCGLQGAGKTTAAGKLARRWQAEGKKPLLVAADVQRPAAIEQLKILGAQINAPVHFQTGGDPVAICREALAVARENNHDVIILDTAGRLHVDDALMTELENIASATEPAEILFICDAMIGQSAVDTALEFKKRLALTGAVMTKLDSDARGGAALSLRALTGVGIKYVSVGEKLDALEEFYPDRMAGRILGMGDVVSLVEKAQQVIDERDAEKMRERLEKNEFTLEDFQKQLAQIKKLGSIKELLKLVPGIGGKIAELDIDEGRFRKIEAIIQSMTVEERRHPEILGHNRLRRIALGSGHRDAKGEPFVKPVRELLDMFGKMRKMIGKMGKMGLFSAAGASADLLKNDGENGDAPVDMSGMPQIPGMRRALGQSKHAGTKATRDVKKERKKEKARKKHRR